MKNIWIQSLAITGFVFLLLWGANGITDLKLFNSFDPISQALSDFELTDIAFSNLRPEPKADLRIVMVNFANLPRRDVAQMLMTISAAKPRVIGMDGFYNCEGGLRDAGHCPQLLDTLGNLMLASAIESAGNVVLVEKLLQSEAVANDPEAYEVMDSIEYSDPIFSSHAKNAFANLITDANYQEDVKICRSFNPSIDVKGGKTEYAFAVQLCMMYDSVKTKTFLARNKAEELINYRGNVEYQDVRLKNLGQKKSTSSTKYPITFFVVGPEDFEKEIAPELFKDNIVIMGFLGDYFGDPTHSDKYFTPLNKKVAGRAYPDMFGVVVHANIVSMILNGDYVDELAEWQKIAVAIIVCFFTVALFIKIDESWPVWYDALQAIIQIVQLILISFLVVQIFAQFSFKLDLSVTLGVAALVGPSYDIFKSLQNELRKRFTKPRNLGLKNT